MIQADITDYAMHYSYTVCFPPPTSPLGLCYTIPKQRSYKQESMHYYCQTYCTKSCSVRESKKFSIKKSVKETVLTQMLNSSKTLIMVFQWYTCEMFFSIQCTWDDIPRGSEPPTHPLSQNAIDKAVWVEHWHHVLVTPAGEPFPIHLLGPLVFQISGHQWLLLSILYHWDHPSAQGAT